MDHFNKNCYYCYWFIRTESKCFKNIKVVDHRIANFCKYYEDQGEQKGGSESPPLPHALDRRGTNKSTNNE